MTDRGDLPRLIVRPFNGRKGPEYTSWRRELLDALALKGDDDFSLAETVERTDRRAGLSATETKRRKRRLREAYGYIIASISDQDLRNVLRGEANLDGVAALTVLDRECAESQSALARNERILKWHGTTIAKDVGAVPSRVHLPRLDSAARLLGRLSARLVEPLRQTA